MAVKMTELSSSSDEAFTLATSSPKKRAGRIKFKETRHPIFRGVRRRNNDKWVCELREPNKKTRIWLGTYATPEMAARAHDVAALALRGKAACLNFADSAWRLPVPASSDALDIRRAAAEAAEIFNPQASEELSNDATTQGNVEAFDGVVSSEEVSSNDFNFMDEEEMLDMPSLLASMAQGLLLFPPTNNNWDDDHSTTDIDMSLWSYSI